MEFGKNFVIKMWKKLKDKFKQEFTKRPYSTYTFKLTVWQQEQVDKLYKQYGGMDYCFYFTGIGIGFKVKIWKTNEWIDLTDVSSW